MKKYKIFQSKIPLKQRIFLVLLGIFLFFVLLETGLRLGGFVLTSLQEHRNNLSIRQKGAYRILCLGESTTGRQYPPFLEEILNQRNTGIKFSVIDDGTAGFNTTTIIAKLENNLDKFQPQMVIAMMGVNDGGERVFWENKNTSCVVSFFKSFRVYKLARLIYLHARDKIVENQRSLKEAQNIKPPVAIVADLPAVLNEKIEPHVPSYASVEHLIKDSEPNLKDDTEYTNAAELYSIAGKFVEAEETLKKAIAINPQNNHARALLIGLYWNYKYFPRSVSAFEEAIKANPENAEAYFSMAVGYRVREEYALAEKLLKKTLEIVPDHTSGVSELVLIYRLQGRYSEIEDLLKKYIKRDPRNEHLYSLLGAFYWQTGKYRSAEECYRESNQLRALYYNPTTRNNYRELKRVLDKRGIKLVCMQYPVRSLKPLKDIFPVSSGIVFIDNEKVFKDALKKNNYGELFRDNFGGDFGHCTDKGNRLLAWNIANVILKAVFNK